MRNEFSNGWWFMNCNGERLRVDERWHSRFITFPEEKTTLELKRSLNWVYDDYFSFENSVLVKAYSVPNYRAKNDYGLDDGFCMIQSLYVHPDERGKGNCKQFLKHAMKIADDNESYITAVCRPFHHYSEKTGTDTPNIKQIAKDFTHELDGMYFEPVTKKKGKQEQRLMASTLEFLGWEKIDLTANMEFPELFGEFGYIY